MTNAELLAKIKAEIESKRAKNWKGENWYYDVNDIKNAGICRHRRILCEELLRFLSTLESEKPMNPEELGKEITRTYHDGSVADTTEMDHVDYENIARHFYELGCRRTAEKYDEIEYNRQMAEESVLNDLEEAAWEYAPDLPSYNIGGGYLPPQSRDDLRTAFKDGAKWQAEQDKETIELAEDHAYLAGSVNEREKMMKEAVEGEITRDNRGNNVVRAGVFNKDFECGDKVKIIIVKEN